MVIDFKADAFFKMVVGSHVAILTKMPKKGYKLVYENCSFIES